MSNLFKSSFLPVVLFAFYLTMASGCGPTLSDQRQIALDPNNVESIVLGAIGNDQTIKVTAKSTGAPIQVHIHLAGDEDEVDQAVTLRTSSDKIIASDVGKTEIVIKALIPANKEAVVRLQTTESSPANVELLISN